jgi:hypothetical protein
MRLALCTGAARRDPELFDALFFPANEGSTVGQVRAMFCNMCPVRADCMEWATDMGIPWGIWGGLTTAERTKLRRRRTRVHCPVCTSTDVRASTDAGSEAAQVCMHCGHSWTADKAAPLVQPEPPTMLVKGRIRKVSPVPVAEGVL